MNAVEAWQALKDRKNVVLKNGVGAGLRVRAYDGNMQYEDIDGCWQDMTLNEVLTSNFEVA